MNLQIDNEFRDLIPPLSDDEKKQLEENILRDGIQDPLKVWNGILIDGHNRYEIAQAHGRIQLHNRLSCRETRAKSRHRRINSKEAIYMSDSLEKQKGDLAEEIVLSVLRAKYSEVHDQRGFSLYDFGYTDSQGNKYYADAKARALNPFWYGNRYGFLFSKEKLDRYRALANEKGFPFEIWCVEAYEGKIYVATVDNLFKNYTTDSGGQFPYLSKGKQGEELICVHPQQFACVININSHDTRLAKLRQLFGVGTQEQNMKALPVEILTAPGGINIDILRVDGLSQYFVKAARIYCAFTKLNDTPINKNHALVRAAQALGITVHRFETQRLSGNVSYGTKGYYFAVDDVPKVLAQYYEHNHRSKMSKQIAYNDAANKLRRWFQSNVLPTYGTDQIQPKNISECLAEFATFFMRYECFLKDYKMPRETRDALLKLEQKYGTEKTISAILEEVPPYPDGVRGFFTGDDIDGVLYYIEKFAQDDTRTSLAPWVTDNYKTNWKEFYRDFEQLLSELQMPLYFFYGWEGGANHFASEAPCQLKIMPQYKRERVQHALYKMRHASPTKYLHELTKSFSAEYETLWQERFQTKQAPEIVTLKGNARHVKRIQMPDEQHIDIFACENDFFVLTRQISDLLGYKNGSGSSDGSNLGEAICKKAQRYTIQLPKKTKTNRAIRLLDMLDVLHEFQINHATEEQYKLAQQIIDWSSAEVATFQTRATRHD